MAPRLKLRDPCNSCGTRGAAFRRVKPIPIPGHPPRCGLEFGKSAGVTARGATLRGLAIVFVSGTAAGDCNAYGQAAPDGGRQSEGCSKCRNQVE